MSKETGMETQAFGSQPEKEKLLPYLENILQGCEAIFPLYNKAVMEAVLMSDGQFPNKFQVFAQHTPLPLGLLSLLAVLI